MTVYVCHYAAEFVEARREAQPGDKVVSSFAHIEREWQVDRLSIGEGLLVTNSLCLVSGGKEVRTMVIRQQGSIVNCPRVVQYHGDNAKEAYYWLRLAKHCGAEEVDYYPVREHPMTKGMMRNKSSSERIQMLEALWGMPL